MNYLVARDANIDGGHKTKDGTIVDKAYEGCIHYYRRDEITGNDSCHLFCIDGPCCEESKGTVCQMIHYAPGKKSDKIRYIYFKISEEEKEEIEKHMGCNRRYQTGIPPIIDADQDQRDQLTTRLSLRRDK